MNRLETRLKRLEEFCTEDVQGRWARAYSNTERVARVLYMLKNPNKFGKEAIDRLTEILCRHLSAGEEVRP